jgi:hypothetical protein
MPHTCNNKPIRIILLSIFYAPDLFPSLCACSQYKKLYIMRSIHHAPRTISYQYSCSRLFSNAPKIKFWRYLALPNETIIKNHAPDY